MSATTVEIADSAHLLVPPPPPAAASSSRPRRSSRNTPQDEGDLTHKVVGVERMRSSAALLQKMKEKEKEEKKKNKKEKKSGSEKSAKETVENDGVPPVPLVPLSRVFKMGKGTGWKMAVGTMGAMIQGLAFPAFCVVLGQLFDAFFAIEPEKIRSETLKYALIFLGVGGVSFLASFLQLAMWGLVGNSLVRELRVTYFKALMKQEMGFFDARESGELVAQLLTETQTVQNGVGEKVGTAIALMMQLFGGIGVAFYYGWKLTLVLLAISPVIAIAGFLQFAFIARIAQSSTAASSTAGSMATEVISNVRTVFAFNQQNFEEVRIGRRFSEVRDAAAKNSIFSGLGFGFSMFAIFSVYCLGFYVGGRFVADGTMQPGDVLTVFFSVVLGGMGLGQLSQVSPDFAKAKSSASNLFFVIDRQPLIDPNLEKGALASNLRGDVEISHVQFFYPTRPDTKVLRNISFKIPSGARVALVGESGSGKSTIISLIERFYDVDAGQVLIDGRDVREFNLFSLRDRIGLVQQEPPLFTGTIADNIRYGSLTASQAEIEQAARTANAHDFILNLEKGYETLVGEAGVQLSGGQKQRVAIARAVLRNPTILLLDEATSALDAESEHLVQEALNRLMVGRTSIIIAHRLSTVRDCDCLYVMRKGQIVESGTFAQLEQLGGFFTTLVSKQLQAGDDAEPAAPTAPQSA